MSRESGSGILRSSFGVAFATLSSRILGLLRVMLEARVLGGGSIASAWFLAFALPNLLRRLLGEGALGTALIPIITETEVREGETAVRRDLGVVFGVLGLLLAVIVAVVSAGAWLLLELAPHSDIELLKTERTGLMLQLLIILMPYAFFICLIGVIGAVLNTCKQFVLPALGALLLNIFLVCGLLWGFMAGVSDITDFLHVQAYLVLTSGILQFILMVFLLYRYRRLPFFSLGMFRNTKVLKELWHLALPGFIGGMALQISFLVDRFIAFSIGPQAVPALTNVDRIIDLPIGIFAISLGSVLMASISRSAASGNSDEIADNLSFCLRHVFFISVPMACGMLFLWRPVLTILCLGGNYTVEDLDATRTVALFYGLGIPLFCTLKVILPAYYARKQMRLPLISSLTAICVNIVLNLVLMFPLKQGGIALATVISSLVNNALLVIFLKRQGIFLHWQQILSSLLRCTIPAFAAGAGGLAFYRMIRQYFSAAWHGECEAFLLTGAVFALIYFSGTFLLKAPETKELKTMVSRRKAAQ